MPKKRNAQEYADHMEVYRFLKSQTWEQPEGMDKLVLRGDAADIYGEERINEALKKNIRASAKKTPLPDGTSELAVEGRIAVRAMEEDGFLIQSTPGRTR